MIESEQMKLLRMEDQLRLRVVGQDDAVTAVANAVRRSGATPPVALAVEDFEVVETERRASAAVALCVDLSFSTDEVAANRAIEGALAFAKEGGQADPGVRVQDVADLSFYR